MIDPEADKLMCVVREMLARVDELVPEGHGVAVILAREHERGVRVRMAMNMGPDKFREMLTEIVRSMPPPASADPVDAGKLDTLMRLNRDAMREAGLLRSVMLTAEALCDAGKYFGDAHGAPVGAVFQAVATQLRELARAFSEAPGEKSERQPHEQN